MLVHHRDTEFTETTQRLEQFRQLLRRLIESVPPRLCLGESLSSKSDESSQSAVSLVTSGVQSVLRGRISFVKATREAFRRGRAAVQSRRERTKLDDLASQPARLLPEFQSLSSSQLLKHFRERSTPSFLPGFEAADATASLQRDLFPSETEQLIESAR